MGNCLLTQLKGIVNNDSLITLYEYKVGFSYPAVSSTPTFRVAFNSADSRKVRALSDNVQLSLDGSNWANNITITPTLTDASVGYYEATFYAKSNGFGYIAIDDKYNMLSIPQNNIADDIHLERDQYDMLYNLININAPKTEEPINLHKFPNLMVMGGVTTYGKPMVRYIKEKRIAEPNYMPDIYAVYFEDIKQVTDYLEDTCSKAYKRRSHYSNIAFDAQSSRHSLDDTDVAPYRSRLYTALKTYVTKFNGGVYLWEHNYTVSGNNLLCDGNIVTP